jgi:5-methylcytosine-specific restriction enzyme A
MARPELKRLYNSSRWLARQRQQLQAHPLCCMCMQRGRVEAATVADHIVPHKGDEALFFAGELQSLCIRHHNRSKQQIERRGFDDAIDDDGWPTHPNHPANRKR